MIYFILLTSFVLRLLFMSPWLEDWDSVQFALGLHEFSIVEHQPHPPGYPLYILLGRVANLIFLNDTKSLTAISAFLGTLSVVPFFLLLKRLFNNKVAIFASIIFILIPVHWTLSEIPISNIPGFFSS